MTTYNGHKNWNHWNVSLWIDNDAGLYNEARQWIRASNTKHGAACNMLRDLRSMGITHTPDGVPFSKTTILAAMRGL